MELLGHRGGIRPDGPPENTLAAVEAALAAGADGVEVDIRLTADGVPVCLHDPDLRRVASRRDPVAATSYAALRRVPLPGGHGVAGLDDMLAAVRGRGRLVLDLKDGDVDPVRLVGAVRRSLRRSGHDDVVISSFAPAVLAAAAAALPGLPRALITGPTVPAVLAVDAALRADCAALHAHRAPVLADHWVVERAARHRLPVRCWTVNRAVDARLLEVAGVAGVISDDVAAVRAAPIRRLPQPR